MNGVNYIGSSKDAQNSGNYKRFQVKAYQNRFGNFGDLGDKLVSHDALDINI